MLNMTGKKILAEYITSKDNTKDIIENLARYYLQSVKQVNEFVLQIRRFYPIINGYKMFRA